MTPTIFAFVAFVIVLLVVYACMYKHTEAFSNAFHYCIEKITPSNNTGDLMSAGEYEGNDLTPLKKVKHKCDRQSECRSFTCEDPSNHTQCKRVQFYKEGTAKIDSANRLLYKKSRNPCHNWCFQFADKNDYADIIKWDTDTEGNKKDNATYTIEGSKDLCNRSTNCKMFTCDVDTNAINNNDVCNGFQMYQSKPTKTKTGLEVQIIQADDSSQKKEMYTKTQEACKKNVIDDRPSSYKIGETDYTIISPEDIRRSHLLPYAYNAYGGMKKYPSRVGATISGPKQVDKRVCRTYEENGEQDTNCFLPLWDGLFTDGYNQLKNGDLNKTDQGWRIQLSKENTFYKDEQHNVYKRNSKICCASDVSSARTQAEKLPEYQAVDIPTEHHCNTLEDSVFSEKCNSLCKGKNMTYRGDLKACVPKSKECDFHNKMTCNINSPYKEKFNTKCATQNKECNTDTCQDNPMSISENTCKDGQPYYTYVGTYDSTVGLLHKMIKLQNILQENKITLIDPAFPDDAFATLESVKWKLFSYYQIIMNNGDKYNVMSLSFKMNYIEIYSVGDPVHTTKKYFIKIEKKET